VVAKAQILKTSLLVSGASGVAITGGVVAPLSLQAASRSSEQQSSFTTVIPDEPEHRATFVGLREITAGGGLVLHAWPGSSEQPAWVAFWTKDHRDPGAVNISEVLVVAHNPLLQTVTAYSSPDRSSEKDGLISFTDATSQSMLDWIRARSDIEAQVVGVGVTDMTASWSGSMEATGQLTIALTWAPKLADSSTRRESVSIPAAFTVELPGVIPAR
jgi:hypothetical protein